MRLNEREDILDLTREWTGERFPNGRPRVSDEKIEIIKTLTQEEIWHPLYFSGYRFQFQGGLRTLHPGKKSSDPGEVLLLVERDPIPAVHARPVVDRLPIGIIFDHPLETIRTDLLQQTIDLFDTRTGYSTAPCCRKRRARRSPRSFRRRNAARTRP